VVNSGARDDQLLGGSTPVAETLQFHSAMDDNGVMKMREVAKGLEIKPGQTIVFKPGGYHVMFKGLKKGLVQGQHVAATLEFEKAGKVAVDFAVESIGAQSGGEDSAMPGMKMGH